MDKKHILSLRKQLNDLSRLVESLQTVNSSNERKNYQKEIDFQIAKIQPTLPSSIDKSLAAIHINREFYELLENYNDILSGFEGDGDRETTEEIELETVDFEEEKKKIEKAYITEANKLSKELINMQMLINQRFKEDTDNLEKALEDSETTVVKTSTKVKHLATASEEERKKREFRNDINQRISGRLFGNSKEVTLAQYVSGWFSKLIRKRHQQKIEAVMNME